MKFIRKYLKNIIIDCLTSYDRDPIVIEIIQPEDSKEVNVNIDNSNFVSSASQAALTILPKVITKKVWVFGWTGRTVNDIFGVYDSHEKAYKAYQTILVTGSMHDGRWIIEKEVL